MLYGTYWYKLNNGCFRMCMLWNTEDKLTVLPSQIAVWLTKKLRRKITQQPANVVEEYEVDWTQMLAIFPSSKTPMKALCQNTVQPHCIFDHSDVFLETQKLLKENCVKGNLCLKSGLSVLILFSSLPCLCLLMCRCSLHYRVEVGFRRTLRWLVCQDAVQPSGSDAVEPMKIKISHMEQQETRKSGCQCVRTACFCVCQLAFALMCPVEQDAAISHVGMKLNHCKHWPPLHPILSHQVPTSGLVLVDRPPPLQIMRTPFTRW